VKEQYVCTVCGDNYVIEYGEWRKRFDRPLAKG
jgi:transposase-like protein